VLADDMACLGTPPTQEAYATAIIRAVNSEREQGDRRPPDGCRQFWRGYQLLQNEFLDLALAHEAFGKSLASHSDEAALAKMKAVEAASHSVLHKHKFCTDEIDLLVESVTHLESKCHSSLQSFLNTKADAEEEAALKEKEAKEASAEEDSFFGSLRRKMTVALKEGVSAAASSAGLPTDEASLEKRRDKARKACEDYRQSVNTLNKRRERYMVVEAPMVLTELEGLELKRLDKAKSAMLKIATAMQELAPRVQHVGDAMVRASLSLSLSLFLVSV
jgi:hypothetical protein